MNDGTAYPVVMFGLFLLGEAEAKDYGTPLAILLSAWGNVGLALCLRERYHEALGMEEFLTLGLVAAVPRRRPSGAWRRLHCRLYRRWGNARHRFAVLPDVRAAV